MKKIIRFNTLILLLLTVTLAAAGQYTGTNPNVAGYKKATASDSTATTVPANAIDTLLATQLSIPNGPPSWLQVDLGAFHFIDGYGMTLPVAGELPLTYIFQGSLNGSTWTDLRNGSNASSGTFTHNFTYPDIYRYIRVYITSKDVLATFAELYVYGYEIFPPNPPVVAGPAMNTTQTGFTANWSYRSAATGYTIEVATDIDFISHVTGYSDLDVGNVVSYDVTGLSANTNYYYRVKAYNLAGSTAGSNKIMVTTLKQTQTINFAALPDHIYGDADFDLSATASSGLPVSFASSDATVATVAGNTVTIVGAGTTTITASQAGNTEYEPAIPVDREQVINVKPLSVTGVTAADKVYDGTTDAVLSGGTLVGLVGTDVVTLADATSGTFAQSDAGTGIAVTTAMTLAGADMDNYSIVQPTDVTGNITAKELTVTGATAASKEYDGTTDAAVSGGTLSGVVGADIVNLTSASSGTFAQADVGTAIAVTTAMTLAGADAGNYTLVQPAGITADITQKDLTVVPDNKSREACKANPVFTLSYSGFVGAETSSVLVSEPVAATTADQTSAPGSYDITASGGDGGNYNLVFSTGTLLITADVTDPVLSVKPFTVTLDEGGNASITPADVVTLATDNCGVVDTTLSQSAFTTVDIGEVVVEVIVSDAAGNSTSEFAVITIEGTIGFKDLSERGASVYPNPTSGKVELVTGIRADGLKVMDMTGKTVLSRSNLKAREAIDLSEFSNGIYIFQLQMGDALLHIKVIKK